MALSDLTDAAAVSRALDEHDRLGRDAFLSRYRFGRARTYFVLRNGRTYPSKAIAAAAHGFQHGTPLTSDEFSGGDATVAAKLSSMGFRVLQADREWMYDEGDIALRSDIHATYGGSTYGGIEPSRTSPNVMIYTDPQQGALNGYDYDGWDANDPNVFYYTGEGRHGDQTMREGNKAILNHETDGRALRLWETLEEPAQVGGKRQRYVGEFYVDAAAPYRMAPAPDAAGDRRQVIVFRLVRAGEEPAAVPAAPPSSGALAEAHSTGAQTTRHENSRSAASDATEASAAGDDLAAHGPDDDFTGDADVSIVPSEQNTALEFELAPSTGKIAKREEAQLVAHFETWLRNRSHHPQRLRIEIPGERHELVTDTYDTTDGVLYEAKSKSDRASVRLAIGQLLDYLRFAPEASGSILLPDEPTTDVKRLVHSVGFGLTYRKLGSWVTEPSARDAV